MFNKKTVVVIGAGASKEADLPLGVELKSRISRLTTFIFEYGGFQDGDYDFYNELRRAPQFSQQTENLRVACAKVSRGINFVSSVDSFLEIHGVDPDIQICTKAAIAQIILKAEGSSKLAVDRSNIYNELQPGKLNGTWCQELAQILFEKVGSNNIEQAFAPVTFVVFNYDRCVEWLIFHAIQGLYFQDRATAAKLMKSARFLHPFGEVGAPSWLSGGSSGEDLGADVRGRLVSVSNGIRTFTERVESMSCADAIGEAVSSAETLVFLGFSFHPECMALLRPLERGASAKRIFGTSLGMSKNDKESIERLLAKVFTSSSGSGPPEVKLDDLPCGEFLRQYKRSLAVA